MALDDDRDIGIIFYSLLLRKVVITAGPQYTIKYCVPVNDLMPCQSQVLFDLTAACLYILVVHTLWPNFEKDLSSSISRK